MYYYQNYYLQDNARCHCPMNLYPATCPYCGNYFAVPVYIANGTDYPGYHSYRQIEFSCQDPALINAVADYAGKYLETEHPDHLGAFPNFEEGVEGGQHRYSLVLFYRKTADYAHALKSEFGNVERRNMEAMMIATDKFATKRGYKAGIPDFHESPQDYGVFLFKNEAVDIKHFSLEELDNPRNVRDIFVAVNRKARSQRYESGFPTFTRDTQGRYKVAFIKDEYAELRSVASSALNLPEYYERFCQEPMDRIVIGCISGLFGHADVLGSRAMRDFRDFLRRYLEGWVKPENIFYQSWNPVAEDNPFDTPATEILNGTIQRISRNPSYLALIGFSYGGWAVSRLSRITTRIPDFIGLIDPVFGPINRIMDNDIPRGSIIKSWYQKYAIQELEPCTGASKVPCSTPKNGIACGNQNVHGAENIHEEFLKNWEGNRERKPCPIIGRVPIKSTHANIAGNQWIWRQITEKILSDIKGI